VTDSRPPAAPRHWLALAATTFAVALAADGRVILAAIITLAAWWRFARECYDGEHNA